MGRKKKDLDDAFLADFEEIDAMQGPPQDEAPAEEQAAGPGMHTILHHV